MTTSELRALAEAVAREAGALLRAAFEGPELRVSSKSTPTDLVSEADHAAVSALSLALTESGALIRELSPRHASLEDLFFRLTEGQGVAEPAGAAPTVGSVA